MSLLPQRKKSAEEIAKLRESLGIPAAEQEPLVAQPSKPPADIVDTIVPGSHEASLLHPPVPVHLEPEPVSAPVHQPGPKPVHSLKRSERIPTLPVEEEFATTREIAAHATNRAPDPVSIPASPRGTKPVRSLKKSEQAPLPAAPRAAEAPPSSSLPHHRHSDAEIAEIRRRQALALLDSGPVPNPKLAAAHLALIIPGYLLAAVGAVCFVHADFPMAATAICSLLALGIAGFMFLRRPISRHHAAFIAVIALFVIVFGALHFFPHLRHAT
jgi:hypothetical protein